MDPPGSPAKPDFSMHLAAEVQASHRARAAGKAIGFDAQTLQHADVQV